MKLIRDFVYLRLNRTFKMRIGFCTQHWLKRKKWLFTLSKIL